jgi:hypothetical protein
VLDGGFLLSELMGFSSFVRQLLGSICALSYSL